MPTNEEVIEVTENENEPETTPRSVSVLLNILETTNTFQGMSDAEIQSIIDYKIQIAIMAERNNQQNAALSNYHASVQTNTVAALQSQERMLQSIINRASDLQLQVVQYG